MAKVNVKSTKSKTRKNIFDILLKRKKEIIVKTKQSNKDSKKKREKQRIKKQNANRISTKKEMNKKTEKKQKAKKIKKERKTYKEKHKETIEQILKGIKEIEYASKRQKIIEAEPHIEHILTPKNETEKEEREEKYISTAPIISKKKIRKEIEKVSYAQIKPEKNEIQMIKTVATLQKERKSFEKPSLIKTGIPGFDEMCGGGIEEKSIVLINGDAGSGKTIFGLQFLYEGAKNGEAGLYISFGEPKETLYPRMLNFGMNFQQLEDKQLFFMIEYQPHEIAKIMQEEGGTLYDLITAYNIKRVVVDTITPYLMQFNDPYQARLALVRLFNVFRKFKVTTMLLNEWSSQLPTHPSTAVAEFLADGIVYLIHKRSPEGVQIRGIEIWKMTGVGHTEVARPFAFTPKGIVIYPNERLFFGGKDTK